MSGDRHDLMTTAQVAEHFGVKIGTVQKWRHNKTGPPFISVSSHSLFYNREDVERWGRERVENVGGRPKKSHD